jgi:hypothetical protein
MQLLPHGYLELKQARDKFAQRWQSGVLDRELVRMAGLSMLLFNVRQAARSSSSYRSAAAGAVAILPAGNQLQML